MILGHWITVLELLDVLARDRHLGGGFAVGLEEVYEVEVFLVYL